MYAEEQKPHFHENVLSVFLVIFFNWNNKNTVVNLNCVAHCTMYWGSIAGPKRTTKHELAGMHMQSLLGQPFNSIPKVQVVPFGWGGGGVRPFFPNLKSKFPSCPWEVFIFAQLGANRSTWDSFSGHTFTKWGHGGLCSPRICCWGDLEVFFTSTRGHPVSYQKKLNRSRGSNWEKC